LSFPLEDCSEFGNFVINLISGVDVDGQTSNVISSNWEVTDPDSNIDFCEWSIGKSYFY